MAMLMVGFTDCAAELVLGISMAGDNVAASLESYLNAEDASRRLLGGVGTH